MGELYRLSPRVTLTSTRQSKGIENIHCITKPSRLLWRELTECSMKRIVSEEGEGD